MNGTRDQFLARPVSPVMSTVESVGATSHLFEYTAQRCTLPYDLRETRCVRGVSLPSVSRQLAWSLMAHSGDRGSSPARRRLVGLRRGTVSSGIQGAGFHGAHRHRDVAMPSDENDGNLNVHLSEFLL